MHYRTKLLVLLACFSVFHASAQSTLIEKEEKQLTSLYSKITSSYSGGDSLLQYGERFKNKLTALLKKYPATLSYPFNMLQDSSVCIISTSPDSLLRAYCWNTWQGGSMPDLQTIFQFRSGEKIFIANRNNGGGSPSTISDIFLLEANGKKYYLVVSSETYSSRDAYEKISVFAISGGQLDQKVRLIQTASGLNSAIGFSYDFFSVVDRPERPVRLIRYDSEAQMIHIPVVLEGGHVTNRFIRYQFNGQYFVKLKK